MPDADGVDWRVYAFVDYPGAGGAGWEGGGADCWVWAGMCEFYRAGILGRGKGEGRKGGSEEVERKDGSSGESRKGEGA